MSNTCQGLPSGPCPDGRCDRTVKYTVYNLFLCPLCERERKTALSELHQSQSQNKAIDKTEVTKRGQAKSTGVTRTYKASASKNKQTNEISSNSGNNTELTSASGVANKNDENEDSTYHGGHFCSSCLLAIDDAVRSIQCDICASVFHQRCTPMTVKVFDRFVTNVKITGWVCSDCKETVRSSFQQLKQAISHLVEELASVKLQLAELNDANKQSAVYSQPANSETPINAENAAKTDTETVAMPTDVDGVDKRTALIVQRTLSDSSRRKKNVIITGLPEDAARSDRAEFLLLCEQYLSIKPLIADNSCKRIGQMQGDRPRKLLVRLGSEETATAILQAARHLRNSDDEYTANNIYINPDLSPAAAQLAFEARERRRNRNQLNHRSTRTNVRGGNTIDQETNSLQNTGGDLEDAVLISSTKAQLAEVRVTQAPAAKPGASADRSLDSKFGTELERNIENKQIETNTAELLKASGNQPKATTGSFR